MPWVRFTGDFDWRPHPRQVVAYKTGMEQRVTTPCANAAISANKAVQIKTPSRDEAKR